MKRIKAKKNLILVIMALVLIGVVIERIVTWRTKATVYVVSKVPVTHGYEVQEDTTENINITGIVNSEDYVTDIKELRGRVVRFNHTVNVGQPIHKSSLMKEEEESAAMLREDELLFSVEANSVNTHGNILRSGHIVDIYSSVDTFDNTGVALPLLQGVRVINVKDRFGNEVTHDNESDVISFSVPKSQIGSLHTASLEGKILLNLNSLKTSVSRQEIENGNK